MGYIYTQYNLCHLQTTRKCIKRDNSSVFREIYKNRLTCCVAHFRCSYSYSRCTYNFALGSKLVLIWSMSSLSLSSAICKKRADILSKARVLFSALLIDIKILLVCITTDQLVTLTVANHNKNIIYTQLIIIIIIIIIINCIWVVTRWQWLFYMYTKYEIVY